MVAAPRRSASKTEYFMVLFFELVDMHALIASARAASAYFDTRVADVVLGLIDERLGLLFRFHSGLMVAWMLFTNSACSGFSSQALTFAV